MSSADEYDGHNGYDDVYDDDGADDYGSYSDGGYTDGCHSEGAPSDNDHEPTYEDTGLDDRYDQGYEDGYESGYEDGYEQGYDDGYEQGYQDGHDDDPELDHDYDEPSVEDVADEWQHDDEDLGTYDDGADEATEPDIASEAGPDVEDDTDRGGGEDDSSDDDEDVIVDWRPVPYRYEPEALTPREDKDTPRRQFDTHLRQMWPAFPDVDPRLIRMTDRPWSGSLLAAPYTPGRSLAPSDWVTGSQASASRVTDGFVLPRPQRAEAYVTPIPSRLLAPIGSQSQLHSRHPRVSFGTTTRVPPSETSSVASSRVSISRSELGAILGRLEALETRLATAEGAQSTPSASPVSTNGSLKQQMKRDNTCFTCNNHGHLARDFPFPTSTPAVRFSSSSLPPRMSASSLASSHNRSAPQSRLPGRTRLQPSRTRA